MRAFLLNWLAKFPGYARSDLYIAGESYAGHYVPTLAATILAGNALGPANTLNLKGILIGNAWTDAPTDNYGAAFHWWRCAAQRPGAGGAVSGSADASALRAATI
jgi:serine carboxypeptidase-like clade 2